jgi:outer membrane protein OmpA-like peptidoglycan-associated protein
MRAIALIVAAFAALTVTSAQVRIDVGTGLGFTTAQTSFTTLPGFPSCCPLFESGSGTGGSFGLGVDVPISSSFFGSLRLALNDRSHTLSTEERVDVIVGNNLTQAVIVHTMALPLTDYGIETHLGWRGGGFVARGGVGYTLRSYGALRSQEELTSPSGATFSDTRSSVRNSIIGDLPSAVGSSLHVVGIVGLDIVLSRGSAWRLTPEVGLTAALSSVTSAVSWTTIVPSIGLRLSYEFNKEQTVVAPPKPPTVPPAQQIVSLPKETPKAEPKREAPAKKTIVKQRVIIEELEEERYLPVLPYVFFERNNSAIPTRYHRAADLIRLGNARTNVAFHHELLTVVADRLKQDPSAEIVVTGHTSADEDDQRLSMERARAVASVLTDTFGIEARRIKTRSRRLPVNQSLAAGAEGPLADEENRRVEITTNKPELLLPYRIVDTIMTVRTPEATLTTISPTDSIITVTDTVRLFDKRRSRAQDSIVDRFDLIVFPFNKTELTEDHRRVLDIVRTRLGPNARVTVEGRTDVIGSFEENARLSLERAIAVSRELKGRVSIAGRGEPEETLSQLLPEERMLQRVVSILAVVPVVK